MPKGKAGSVLLSFAIGLLISGCVDDEGTTYGDVSTRRILHANINCSDLAQSRSFYEMLGFVVQAVAEETGPLELAAALGLPSYEVRAVTMTLPAGRRLRS